MIHLSQEHISEIPERIQRPTYDRAQVKNSIVHIGVGGFHRSHEAFYTDELLEKFSALDWGICGVGLREADRRISEVFNRQDCLYTIITRHPEGEVYNRVIGAITEFILAVDEPSLAIEKMAHPDTKIVTLTITEGGYNINAAGEFDFNNPDVEYDLQNPDTPRSVFGYLTAALRKRKYRGLPAFTVLSCDNVEHNGDVARYVMNAFASRQDTELGEWIEEQVCFPNSMVDRITPVTTESDIKYLQETFDLIDEWPVTCEPFIQWVVEDKFSNGRPPYEQVGVQFVPDVTPYEKMKLRLLNAGHSVLGIIGALLGHKTINQCINDPVLARFMRSFLDKEATPILDAVEGIDLDSYKNKVEERFANPNIKDNVSRICSESSAKFPKFIIPTIQENLKSGGSIQFATLVLAAWCYYSDVQKDQAGTPIEIIDAKSDQLHNVAKGTKNDVLSFLRIKEIFGNLVDNKRFTKCYSETIEDIYNNKDITHYLNSMD